MAHVRAIPRGSWALVVSACVLSLSILFGSAMVARGDSHTQTFYACLFNGALSQVNTSGSPANCGRGTLVQWSSAAPLTASQTIAREDEYVVLPGSDGVVTVSCEPGEVATGGGMRAEPRDLELRGSYPELDTDNTPIGWNIAIQKESSVDLTVTSVTVYAICMTPGS
jgi:hypothetical protein